MYDNELNTLIHLSNYALIVLGIVCVLVSIGCVIILGWIAYSGWIEWSKDKRRNK